MTFCRIILRRGSAIIVYIYLFELNLNPTSEERYFRGRSVMKWSRLKRVTISRHSVSFSSLIYLLLNYYFPPLTKLTLVIFLMLVPNESNMAVKELTAKAQLKSVIIFH